MAFLFALKKSIIIQTAPFGFFKDTLGIKNGAQLVQKLTQEERMLLLGDKRTKDFQHVLSQWRYRLAPEVCWRLVGKTPQYRTWLLTRATFLCGFSSFGLWKVAAMGAVDVHQKFSLQLLPGFLMPTDPEHCGHTLWWTLSWPHGRTPVSDLGTLEFLLMGQQSSPRVWTCLTLSSARGTKQLYIKHCQLQRGQVCRWAPGALGKGWGWDLPWASS